MEGEGLKKLLEATGIPVKYRSIEPERKMKLPFIAFHFLEAENFGADDKVYHRQSRFSVNLCTARKEKESEHTIEQVFDDACIFWDKTENYITEENMFQITYEVIV